MARRKHQRRSRPRRPTDGVKARVRHRRTDVVSQGKLDRWTLGRDPLDMSEGPSAFEAFDDAAGSR